MCIRIEIRRLGEERADIMVDHVEHGNVSEAEVLLHNGTTIHRRRFNGRTRVPR